MTEWQVLAVCASDGYDPDEWDMSHPPELRKQAVGVCTTQCPVLAECFEDAVRRPPYGMIQAGFGWRGGDPVDAVTGRGRPKATGHRTATGPPVAPPVKEHRPGVGCYSRGCRLEECVAAKAAWRRARRDRLAASA